MKYLLELRSLRQGREYEITLRGPVTKLKQALKKAGVSYYKILRRAKNIMTISAQLQQASLSALAAAPRIQVSFKEIQSPAR